MKKINSLLLVVVLLSIGIGISHAKKIEHNPVIAYATDPNAKEIRAYAVYNDFEENDPWASARNYARGELANRIATLVTTAKDSYRNSSQATENGKKIKTASNQSETTVHTYAQELLRGAREAKSEAFRQKDGTLTVYVCMEMSIEALIDNISHDRRILKTNDDEDDSGVVDFDNPEKVATFKRYVEQANSEHH